MRRKIKTISNEKLKAIADGGTVLDENHIVQSGNLYRVGVAISVEQKLTYTRDGINYLSLNSGEALAADGSYLFEFQVVAGDVINFKIDVAGAYVVKHFILESFLDG